MDFRLGSAQTVEAWWLLLGFPIERSGTLITIHNQHVDVTAACSGMELLGTLTIGGILLLSHNTTSWRSLTRNLLVVVMIAWLANTLRLALLTAAVDIWSIERVEGMGHDGIGYIALGLSLGSIWLMSRSPRGPAIATTLLLWLSLILAVLTPWFYTYPYHATAPHLATPVCSINSHHLFELCPATKGPAS